MKKAFIYPNLLERIEKYFEGKEGHRNDPCFLSLVNRFAGKEVNLKFIGPDAFEEIDDNYWLPECCYKILS